MFRVSNRSLSLASGARAASTCAGITAQARAINALSAAACRQAASLLRLAPALLAVLCIVLGSIASGQTAHFSGYQTPIASGLAVASASEYNGPIGVAVDANGNVYIADTANYRVLKETPVGDGYTQSTVYSAPSGYIPEGIAVDGNGNVYFSLSLQYPNSTPCPEPPSNGMVMKSTPASGGGYTSSVIAVAGWPNAGVAVDNSGNVYYVDNDAELVGDCSSETVYKMTPSGGGYVPSVVANSSTNGLNVPIGVAVDGNGNVYIANPGQGVVLKETLSGGVYTQSTVTTTGHDVVPEWVAVDGNGNVYVEENRAISFLGNTIDNSIVVEETPSGNSYIQGTVPTDYLTWGQGIAVDGNGNVYVVDEAGGRVVKETSTLSGGDFGLTDVNINNPDPPVISVFFTIDTVGALGTTEPVVTQGTSGLDFTYDPLEFDPTACVYSTGLVGDVCSVDVTFNPTAPGTRYGAAELLNSSGAVIATGYVHGTGVGPVVNFPPGTQSTLAGGLSSPGGVAVDASGNVYIANSGAGSVLKETFSAGSYTQSTFPASGLQAPGGVAIDGAGNVYIADYTGNAVYEEIPSGATYIQTTVASGLNAPTAVAVDANGNLYIVNSGTAQVFMETLANGSYTQSHIGTGLVAPYGVAVDGSGNVFISDPGNTAVLKETFSAGSYTQSSIGSGFEEPEGLALDGLGNVYISDAGLKQVLRETLAAGSYTQSEVSASGLVGPAGVAVDGNGNIYIADYLAGAVYEEDMSDAPSLTFATPTTVGTTDIADGPLTVTLKNAGNAALTFPALVIGDNPDVSTNFTLNSNGEDACPLVTDSSSAGTLAAGATCLLPISFEPTFPGSLSGTLVLNDNNLHPTISGGLTQSIALSGTATAPVPAALTSPTPGTKLTGTSITFSWTSGQGIFHYWFNLGTAASGVNAKNIYSGSSTTATSVTVSGLPDNDETIYATLYSLINGAWQPTVYTYSAFGNGNGALLTPTAGTKLNASTTFTWSTGSGVAAYWLNVGTANAGANAKDIYSSGPTTALSKTVTGIPTYGETLYVTLYSEIAGVYQPIVYTYAASGSPVAAALTTPTPSTKLTSSSVTFTWSAGEGVTYYWFNLGTANTGTGAKNIYAGSSTTLTSATATGLPTNGEAIYATLYSYIAGVWQPTVYTYTASGTPSPAVLTAPSPTTQLTSSTVTFTWSPGSPATYYWLNLGTASSGANSKNIYAGSSTTATSVTVSGLPTNGETIYATLYSYIGGAWQPTVYTYTAQ